MSIKEQLDFKKDVIDNMFCDCYSDKEVFKVGDPVIYNGRIYDIISIQCGTKKIYHCIRTVGENSYRSSFFADQLRTVKEI